ncbi:hypothetical protein ACVK00_004600 [Burkholderia sp. PvR073]|nr:hypothetical protein [Burkholderia sp. lyk4-R2A-23]
MDTSHPPPAEPHTVYAGRWSHDARRPSQFALAVKRAAEGRIVSLLIGA